uniref:Uncharacterized protein n=2 Tax=Rhizophora mucronata TaxID=61149 RepID=A0A2P2K368_RHIMU
MTTPQPSFHFYSPNSTRILVSPTRTARPTRQRSQQVQISRKVMSQPSCRRLSYSSGSRSMLLLLLNKKRGLMRRRLHNHLRRRSSKTPEIGPGRHSPESTSSPRTSPCRGSHQRTHGGPHDNPTVILTSIPSRTIILRPHSLPENKGRGSQQRLALQGGRITGSGKCRRNGVGVAPYRHGDIRVGGGRSPGAGGSDNGRLGLTEEPLNGLTVGLVAELPGQLEDTCGAYDGHADSPSAAVNLAVAVFRRGLLDCKSSVGSGRLLSSMTQRELENELRKC